MRASYEVVVVGAGPGGCAVALHLAERGHDVVVVERRAEDVPGGKVCGEGLMPHGRAALERLGVSTEGLGRPFRGIAYHAGAARAVGDFQGRTGLGVRRARLDAALREAVTSCPQIEVRRGVQVRGLSVEPSHVDLKTSAGPLRAQLVVGADGLHSQVRRFAGLSAPSPGVARYGARMHLRLPEGRREPEHVHVHAQGAWEAYITPVGDREINVALLVTDRVARTLRGRAGARFEELVRAFPELHDVFDGAESLSDVAVCGPLRQRVRHPVSDRVVLVGDAAGFVDAVTGEGMSLTLLSAEIAGDEISGALRRGRLDAHGLQGYVRRRARVVRTLCTLTEVVVFGLRHPWWAERVVGALGRRPRAFERFLAVQTGEGSLWSLAGPLLEVTLAVLDPRRPARRVGSPNGELAIG